MTSRLELRIHVAEPWSFERGNGGRADLEGWTDDHHQVGQEEWLVHLGEPFTIEDDSFTTVRISPRYVGETLHKVLDRLVNITVNIVPAGGRARAEATPAAMVGTAAQRWTN